MAWWRGNSTFPCKMNLADVRVLPLRRSGSTSTEQLDEDFQEPTGPYQRMDSTLVLQAQVVFERYERNMTLFNGDTKPVIGRLVFKTTDLYTVLAAAGIAELANGDMITGLGRDAQTGAIKEVDFLILEVRPTAQLHGGPATTTAYFGHNTEVRAGSKRVN